MKFKITILIIALLTLIAGIDFFFYPIPSIKYWTKNPTNFVECVEATRGFIIQTLPAQCEFRGENFVDQSQGQIGILNSPSRQNQNQGNQTFSESEVLTNLKTNWQSAQALITFRPAYHNQTEDAKKIWRSPSAVQFVGKNNILVRFEDDNNVHVAVLKFNGERFGILDVFKNQANFSFSDWQYLIIKYGDSHYIYGDPAYIISTYATDIVRNGQIVSFQNLTSISENIFIKDY